VELIHEEAVATILDLTCIPADKVYMYVFMYMCVGVCICLCMYVCMYEYKCMYIWI
jgi:hypothetical protein